MAQSAALISTEELARRMGAPALRIFDCTTYLRPRPEGGYNAESGRANYDKGHIPGAAFLDLGAELSDPHSKLRFTLPPLDELTKAFAAKGIGHGTFVVLYSHATPTWATRIWWMLRAVGFDDAAILDGGLDKWKAEGREMTREATKYPRSNYPVPRRRYDKEIRAFADEALAQSKASKPLIDVRSPGEYKGEITHMPEYPQEGVLRGGHIPGAKSVPWKTAVNDDGTFKPAAELEKIYVQGCGVSPKTDTVVYCRIGERSSHTWFVLTYLLGLNNVRNYDGSWTEWGNRVAAPIEKGA